MKKLNNKITKIFLSFFIVFFILTNLLITSKADVVNNININSYTDSDEFEYNSKTYNINQYSNELYNKRGGFILKGASHTPEWEKKGEDDPIVKIIPKEYFSLEGNHSYIGQEYGFFITTEKVKMNNDDYGDLYNSTVLVFDVNTEISSDTSPITVTVKPIFQYEYITMIGRGSFKINNVEFGFGIIDEELEEAWVIVKPNSIDIFTYEVKYGMCDKYALKDIAFEANLANEQNLNAFDDGYNAYEDYGYFFTGFDYGFYGHTIEHVKPEEETYLKALCDHLSFFIGLFDNKVFSSISNIYSAVTLISDDFYLLTSKNQILGIKLETTEKTITTVDFPQNRDDQIKKCKEELHKERLIKSVILKPNEKDSDIYYGVNEYFTAKFNVNHSAINNKKKEYTRFTNNLFTKIVNSKTKEEVAIAQGSLTNHIGEQEEKEIKIYQDNNIFLLPNGENSFIFTPLYSGYYNININLDENVLVLIDNEEYTGSNIKIKKYIEKNKTINIKIYKNYSRLVGKINVNLDNENINYTLNPNCELLIPFNSINDMLKITSNNPNVLIDSIYYLNSKNELIEISSLEPDYIITYHFNEHDKYLILLKNISSELQKVMFETKEIESLDEGINSNKNLYKNYTYFKIDSLSSGQYLIILSNDMLNKCRFFNSKFEFSTKLLFSKKGEYIISVDEGKTYYLGFTNYNYSKTDIIIKGLDESYEWEIKGDNGFYLKTHESDISLKRGHNYIINFLINGERHNFTIVSDESEETDNHYIIDDSKKTLLIKEECDLKYKIFIKAKINGLDKDYGLNIFSSFNDENIKINSYNDDRLGLKVKLPSNVKAIDYSVRFGNDESKYILPTNDLKEIEIDVTDISNRYGLGELIITIYNLHLTTNSHSEFNFKFYHSTNMNNLFYSGTGTSNDPYIISSKRHFKNIKFTASNSCYYKLDNDIIINEYIDCIGISEFRGYLDGNEHEIIACEYTIILNQSDASSLETNFGLFRVNYGTIKNLTIVNFKIKTSAVNANRIVNIGFFCGINYGRIENCKCRSNSINFICIEANAGGIAGTNGGTIINCLNNSSTIDSIGNSGLIVGHNNAYGVISNCTTYGEIICHYDDDNQEKQYSIGGVAGTNQGRIVHCRNFATVKFYRNTPCESKILQPRMGTIIGTNYKDGSFEDCRSFSEVNKTGLKTVTWSEGWLWNKKTYEHNQAYYCGSICGQDYR